MSFGTETLVIVRDGLTSPIVFGIKLSVFVERLLRSFFVLPCSLAQYFEF